MLFLKKQTFPSCSLVSIIYWGRSTCSNSGWLSCTDTSKIDNTTFCIFYNLRTILGQNTSPPSSIMAADPRHIVSSMVEAKVCHVTNLAECSRHYGSNSKTKRVQGIVTHVEVIKNSTTNRMTTFVTAEYDMGGMTIRSCRLNIRSVKAVPTPTAVTVPTAGGALLGSTDGDSTTTEVWTQSTALLPTLEALSNTNTSLEQPTVAVARETPPLTTEKTTMSSPTMTLHFQKRLQWSTTRNGLWTILPQSCL